MKSGTRPLLVLSFLAALAAARADTSPPRLARVYLQPVACTCLPKGRHGTVHVVADGGRDVVPVKHMNAADPRLAPDGQTFGFLTGTHLDEQGRERRFIGDALELWRGMKRLRVIEADPVVREWQFRDGGRRVAVYSGPLHGPGWYQLIDVATGDEVGRYEDLSTERAPDWAVALSPDLARRRAR